MSASPFIDQDQEHVRLQAVQKLLALAPTQWPELEALLRVAAHAFDTPMAALSLVHEHDVQPLCHVGPVPTAWPREGSLCDQVVGTAQPVECFDPPPQAQWRYHAAAPITDEHGQVLGCLSVMDTSPHVVSTAPNAAPGAPDRVALLSDLATLAGSCLGNRQRARIINELALTDPLTGLGNRTLFTMALEGELAHAMRTGEPFTVVLVDLDGFSEINAGFGHLAGEDVLREVGKRLGQHVRAGDALARFGGDEFGIVMRHGGADAAEQLAQRIRRSVSAPVRLASGDEVGVGASIGVSAYDDRVASSTQMLNRAHQSLYDSKHRNEQRWKRFMGVR